MRLISKVAAFCYRNRLNGNLSLTSIEGLVRMSYAIILFLPVVKKQYLSLIDFANRTLKMIIFSPRCSNFVYSFSLSSFSVFVIFFKEFEDGQYKLHALIKFFRFLILTTILKAFVHYFLSFFIFHLMIALQKLGKMFFISSKSSFRSRDFPMFVFLSSRLVFPVSHCFRG